MVLYLLQARSGEGEDSEVQATDRSSIRVRSSVPSDGEAILALSDRLTIGMALWRDRAACRRAVHGWVVASLERSPETGAVFVAEDEAGELAGFISVEASTHFSGEAEAYIGELVVDESWEGFGVGRMLVLQAEEWASMRGFRSLTLVTRSANTAARHFYDRLGFLEEEVRLTKLLVEG